MSAALIVHLTGPTVVLDGDVLAVGPGAIVCAAARKLIERGHDPAQRLVARRGDTLCLAGPLGAFAKLTVRDSRHGRPIFCRYQTPGLGARQAPPVTQTERTAATPAARTTLACVARPAA
jgi:hypothetical protein